LPITTGVLKARLQAAEKKIEQALITIQSLRELQQQRPAGIWEIQDILAYEILINLQSGRLDQAQRIISEMSDLQPTSLTRLAKAVNHLSKHNAEKAENILKSLLEEFPYGISTEPLERVKIPLALALLEQNKVYQARQVIAESIRRSAHEQMIQPYLEYGPQIIPLLMMVLNLEELTEEARTFIDDIKEILSASSKDEIQGQQSQEIKDLTIAGSITEREQDVLSLLSQGYSNNDIAQKLCVCESTIKTHLSNIYGKLDVNNRVLAATRADELGLI
jgi:ATP/maltotriose-dependent transcriptional regulator MalT